MGNVQGKYYAFMEAGNQEEVNKLHVKAHTEDLLEYIEDANKYYEEEMMPGTVIEFPVYIYEAQEVAFVRDKFFILEGELNKLMNEIGERNMKFINGIEIEYEEGLMGPVFHPETEERIGYLAFYMAKYKFV